ncbi:MAG: hypothetical protein JST54_08005 [Deltaproteobacteria bacterium]|nr:hypothetical protein [Deltaproteobacteria bacterium]
MAAANRARGSAFDQLLAARLKGVEDAFSGKATLVIAGVTYDQAKLQAKLETLLAMYEQVDQRREEYRKAVADRDAQAQATETFVTQLDGGLKAYFGGDTAVLAKFGIALRKQPAPMSAEERLQRKTKLQETRRLRHTMGSRQKQAVKAEGEPTITVASPVVSAPAANDAPDASSAAAPVPPVKAGAA